MDDLGTDVYAEVGRVTWAAIHVEDATHWMCSFIKPANPRIDRRHIGQKIKDALRVLSAMPATPDREAAAAWLVRARQAIERRNATLHAVPLTWFEPGQPSQSLLGEMPRGTSAYVERPLTVESLAELRSILVEPLGDWRDVVLALDVRAIQASVVRHLDEHDAERDKQ